ncbi:MAG: hypothetical protein ABSD42_09695 [Candidatus Bathyarchaeia archaeon]|jgi:hypothetical protein
MEYNVGLSYLVVTFVAPGIGGNPVWLSATLFSAFGIALFTATVVTDWTKSNTRAAGRIILIILARLSEYSDVASWTGTALWVVPFVNKEIFQASMVCLDLPGATFMLDLALEKT